MEEAPSAPVQVYAIWLPMGPRDTREAWRWTGNLLTDPRVTHLWDGERRVASWFATRLGAEEGEVLWDAYLLYGLEATWEEEPAPLLGWGATIYRQRAALRALLVPYLSAGARR